MFARGPAPETEAISGSRRRSGWVASSFGAITGAPWIVWPRRRGWTSTMADLDDGGGAVAEGFERPAQRAAGRTVTPEDVLAGVFQEVPGQIVGTAGGEPVEGITTVAP